MKNSHPRSSFRASTLTPAALIVAALASFATPSANAQWSATILREPNTSDFSRATCVWDNRQAGTFDNGYSYPVYWQNTPDSLLLLPEPGPDSGSNVNGISATGAVGQGYVRLTPETGYYAGLLWNAAGDQVTQLLVPGAYEVAANGVSGNTQVGIARFETVTLPVLWHGTTESWVNLMPPGGQWGEATATDSNQQVGNVYFGGDDVASLWRGTAASWVSLHPAGWDGSDVYSVSEGQQAGSVYRQELDGSYSNHACVWSSTAASFIDINPAAITNRSEASGIHRGRICGRIRLQGNLNHAVYWSSPSADAFVDLHSFLPSDYERSQAHGIWTDGQSIIRIVGEAQRGEPNYETVAVMWTLRGGGCCTPTGCSTVLSSADCAGTYLGDGFLCSPNACCEAPIGSPRWTDDCDGDLLIDSCYPVADDCNANGLSDACETLDVSTEQFNLNDPGMFTINGSAAIINSAAVLTPADVGQIGSIIRPAMSNLPLSRMRAIFDFRVSDPSTYPADGFSFALLDRAFHNQFESFGEDGPGNHSIAVKFNTWDNGGGEGDNSMEIRYNGTLIVRRTTLPFRIADSAWHRAVIDLSAAGELTVKLTTNPGDMTTIFDAVQLPNYTPFVALVGFGARTGGQYTMQQVDNIRIGITNAADGDADGAPDTCAYCPADFNQDGGIDGGDVDSFFAAWESGDASSDVNQDGGIDGADVGTFFVAWEAGGCG